jgi:hypothetical protein
VARSARRIENSVATPTRRTVLLEGLIIHRGWSFTVRIQYHCKRHPSQNRNKTFQATKLPSKELWWTCCQRPQGPVARPANSNGSFAASPFPETESVQMMMDQVAWLPCLHFSDHGRVRESDFGTRLEPGTVACILSALPDATNSSDTSESCCRATSGGRSNSTCAIPVAGQAVATFYSGVRVLLDSADPSTSRGSTGLSRHLLTASGLSSPFNDCPHPRIQQRRIPIAIPSLTCKEDQVPTVPR